MPADFKIYEGEEELFKLVFRRLIVPGFFPRILARDAAACMHECALIP